jgi:hypothetical protein
VELAGIEGHIHLRVRFGAPAEALFKQPTSDNVTMTVPLTPDQWSSVYGKPGNLNATTLAGFHDALTNLGHVGMTFGGGYFAGHGVNVSGAGARAMRSYKLFNLVNPIVYDRDHERHGHPPMPYHVYKLFFLCETVGGDPKTSSEKDAVSFFPEDRIPPLSLARVTPEQIKHLFDHYRHPEWPTSFD